MRLFLARLVVLSKYALARGRAVVMIDAPIDHDKSPAMLKFIFLLLPIVVPMSGCALGYDSLRSEAQNNCRQKVISDHDECLRRTAQPSFEEYQRARDKQKISDRRAVVATPELPIAPTPP
jgi:hypothetical protein